MVSVLRNEVVVYVCFMNVDELTYVKACLCLVTRISILVSVNVKYACLCYECWLDVVIDLFLARLRASLVRELGFHSFSPSFFKVKFCEL